MGVDAKGRNFSAPRLTPGVHNEMMTYGSPAMIKDQDRQIAIMEDRARRMGYNLSARSSVAQYGGVMARPMGVAENRAPAVNPAVARAQAASRSTSNSGGKKIITIIAIIFILSQFAIPFIAFVVAMLGSLE